MATSGNTINQKTRDQIINGALRKLWQAKGQVADATDTADAAEALNGLVAEYQTLGMQLWARAEYTITLVADQRDYTLGVGQTINTPFPLHLLQAVLRDVNSGSDIDMTIMSRFDFNLLPTYSTGNGGQPVNVSYQPKINIGVLSVWPTPDATAAANKEVVITYQRPLEYFDATANTPDFPQEWANALIYGLALLLSDEYGVPVQDKQWLEKQAEKHLSMAVAGGYEDASIFFQPRSD